MHGAIIIKFAIDNVAAVITIRAAAAGDIESIGIVSFSVDARGDIIAQDTIGDHAFVQNKNARAAVSGP